MIPPRRWRYAAAIHESHHSGFLHCAAIHVSRTAVYSDGSGITEFAPLTGDDLTLLCEHGMDQVAQDLVIDYIGAALVGACGHEALPRADRQAVARYIRLWEEVSGAPRSSILLDKAHLKALRWAMEHRERIASFARQLDCYGSLTGRELQRRLTKTFGPA
jgi:hypothetical protein